MSLTELNIAPQKDLAFVFVHGFRTNSRNTWTGDASVCWTHKLARQVGASCFHYTYPNQPSESKSLRHEYAAENLRDSLDALSLEYRAAILVSHSFGGIVVKELFRKLDLAKQTAPKNQQIMDFVLGLTLISCPNRGHSLAGLSRLYPYLAFRRPAANFKFMEKNGAGIIGLHEDFLRILNASAQSRSVLTFGENIALAKGLFKVPPEDSAVNVHGARHRVLPKDHTTICKNLSEDDPVYASLVDQAGVVRTRMDSL